MIIKGANTAVTREGGATVIDMRELMECMSRRERLTFMKMLDHYNEQEKTRTSRLPVTPRDKRA